jgi:hypothetical protein
MMRIPKSLQGAPATKYITAPVITRRSIVEVFGCASRTILGSAIIATNGSNPFLISDS